MRAMAETRLRKTGNSSGLTLSRDVVAAAGLSEGDALRVTVENDGRIVVERNEGADQSIWDACGWVDERYGRTLKALGK